MASGKKRIAVIAGDGIGKEVMPEGVRVMDAAARKFGIDLHFDHFDFSSWDYFQKHGKMMPDNWKDLVGDTMRFISEQSAGQTKLQTTPRSGARCCCFAVNLISTSICVRRV